MDDLGPRGVRSGQDFQSMRQKARAGSLSRHSFTGQKGKGQPVTQAPPHMKDQTAGMSNEATGRKQKPIAQHQSSNSPYKSTNPTQGADTRDLATGKGSGQ